MIFSKEIAEKILLNKIDTNTLVKMYPEISNSVIEDFSKLRKSNNANNFSNLTSKYKTKASFAINKIKKVV